MVILLTIVFDEGKSIEIGISREDKSPAESLSLGILLEVRPRDFLLKEKVGKNGCNDKANECSSD